MIELAYYLDVGVEGGMGPQIYTKPHFGICPTQCLELPFIEIEKIGRGSDFWGKSRPMF